MATEAGQAAYTRSFLPRYDFLVLNLNNNLLWRCPTARMVEHYDAHVSDRHLDAGVGSGYFLDHCRFPGVSPHIALVDLNPNTLVFVRERIRRYSDVTLYRRNILKPLRIPEKFDSIGISYLLHCLPGLIEDKAVTVFENLKGCLNPGGVVFGSTLLYDLSMKHFFARLALDVYQRSGAMSNRWDTLAGLETALKRSFSRYELHTVGCTAFFSGRV
ncbi:class I SAM-dependent methyltransferase [Nannocystis sp. ILAH1]|uniref:class I SAM-dependent methyltransferase n=1 Tax=unclassified Nannocystis TaxID=2627009 RepID=UPI0022710CB3|nr:MULTISPECIES: class I SAM-dependent methyltransferase [unclassified Nannocystis]MCY0989609.1 class I SAM-dependent methyltransferase [Nannocystis sp. ILAH1]MCY1071291.1 class I SAM-dependent methyltransferase [Nannocystis sp. RBIL2]